MFYPEKDYFRFKFFEQDISGIGIGDEEYGVAKKFVCKALCISAA